MATAVKIPEGGTASLILPGFPVVVVSKSEAAPGLRTWVSFKCCGFATAMEAQIAGQKFGDALSATGAIDKLGVDVGFSRSTLQFSNEIHDSVRRTSGRELRAETHGLTTWEEGTVVCIGLNVHAFCTISPEAFETHVAEWCKPLKSFTERQRNCASLINDSFFVPNTEGQFILRVSAVEALCDETVVGEEIKRVVESLEQHLLGLTTDNATRTTVARRLADLKKKSLRQSYMGKFRTLVSDEAAIAFDCLYGQRSKLVHDGFGRGQLGEANNEALDLAVALYRADLAGSLA